MVKGLGKGEGVSVVVVLRGPGKSQHHFQLGIIRIGNSAAPQTQEADAARLGPSNLPQQYLQVILTHSGA